MGRMEVIRLRPTSAGQVGATSGADGERAALVPRSPYLSGSNPPGTQRSFEPAEVLRQFRCPTQAPAGLLGMFEGEDFGVQSLPREINVAIRAVQSAKSRVVGAVADQGQAGVRSLRANLMFSAGFQTEPQFRNY